MTLRSLLNWITHATHEEQERDRMVQESVRRSDEVADRVKRIAQSDKEWDRLRRHHHGA